MERRVRALIWGVGRCIVEGLGLLSVDKGIEVDEERREEGRRGTAGGKVEDEVRGGVEVGRGRPAVWRMEIGSMR